jgi:hypothetical protein
MTAARSATRSGSDLGTFCKKMKSRCGPQKALAATARKIARQAYGMLRFGAAFAVKTTAETAKKNAKNRILWLAKQAEAAGFLAQVPSGEGLDRLVDAKFVQRRMNGSG